MLMNFGSIGRINRRIFMGKYRAIFDQVIDRKGTGSLKYDYGPERTGRQDLLPMWVADMDFPAPKEALEAVIQRTRHGIFGYTEPDDAYYQALTDWYKKRHGWLIDRRWNTVTPGVVYGIAVTIRAFTKPGDAVLIQPPVYYPFRETIEDNGRRLVENELLYKDGAYHLDLVDFEEKIRRNKVKLFLLCNPHNPVGRVWREDELRQIAEICKRYEVLVFADEIHADFVYPGYRYIPFASLGEDIAGMTITGTSASKTFNLAGLQVSNILISDRTLRTVFRREHAAGGYSQSNTLGLTATAAAYRYGEEWLHDLKEYLAGNLEYIRKFLRERAPGIRLVEPEGTYLVWLDCSGIASAADEVTEFFQKKAGIWGDDGKIFGEKSALFERLNIAAPRSVIEQAMAQIERAYNGSI